ncbi:MAG TPA: class I SAM-dependent methyltransferase [Chloroflexota bacterium]|nr:class I SAM-dependent methyltransferase [Chloroflexota bacterium]
MEADRAAVATGDGFSFDECVSVCDVCGGTAFSPVAPRANVVECEECGYRFVTPRPSQSQIAGAYSDPHFYDGWIDDESGRIQMWSKRLDFIRMHVAAHHLLDIGAGIGTFLALARDRAHWSVCGTEVSLSAVQEARERYGLSLRVGQVEEIGFSAGTFDLVTLWHVLEHVPSPRTLLRTCHDVLVPGGTLVVAVPNDSTVRARVSSVRGRMMGKGAPPTAVRYPLLQPGREVHLSYFTEGVLRRLLASEGFETRLATVDDHYACPSPRTTAQVGAYRLLRRLTGINAGIALLLIARRL